MKPVDSLVISTWLAGWWKVIGCEGRPFDADQEELCFFSRDNWLFLHRLGKPYKQRMQRSPCRYESGILFIRNSPIQLSGISIRVEVSGDDATFSHSDGARVFLRRLSKSDAEIQDLELMRWTWSEFAIFGVLERPS